MADPPPAGGVAERRLQTERLSLAPYAWADFAALAALQADPAVWGAMLGGVRTPAQAAQELEGELRFWGSHNIGMWTARRGGALAGVVGLHERPDARGVALRFAFDPAWRGHGLAREAAAAVLADAHAQGLTRVVAATRADNWASRRVLGAIGMAEECRFTQDGRPKVLYASERRLSR